MIQISFKVFFESKYSVSVNNIDRQTVPQRRCNDAERSLGKFSARSRHDQARRAGTGRSEQTSAFSTSATWKQREQQMKSLDWISTSINFNPLTPTVAMAQL